MRKNYEMSEAQLARLLGACQPGVSPRSPRENANSAWCELGKEMGFDGMTVQPLRGGGLRRFSAVETEIEAEKTKETEKDDTACSGLIETMTTPNTSPDAIGDLDDLGGALGSPEADSPAPQPTPSTPEPNTGEKREDGSPAPATQEAQSTEPTTLALNGALARTDSGSVLPPGHEPIERRGSVDPVKVGRYLDRHEPVVEGFRVSALIDTVFPETPLDHELEETELLSRCYSLPYSIEEIGAAFMAIKNNPKSKILAIKYTRESLMDNGREVSIRFAKDLVDAVAEKIGAYGAGALGTTLMLAPSVEISETPTLNGWRIGASIEVTRGEIVKAEREKEHEQRAPVLSTGMRKLSLDIAMDKALNEFLGSGAKRVQALQGFMRYLTQEDLTIVAAESVVLLDDEHLTQAMKILGRDDLQSLNFAAADEIAARMLDVRPEAYVPMRPLTEQDGEREHTVFSPNGNPVLEKDVERALDILSRSSAVDQVGYGWDESYLAEALERNTGWGSLYASEVAQEAWKRYYSEPDEDTSEEGI